MHKLFITFQNVNIIFLFSTFLSTLSTFLLIKQGFSVFFSVKNKITIYFSILWIIVYNQIFLYLSTLSLEILFLFFITVFHKFLFPFSESKYQICFLYFRHIWYKIVLYDVLSVAIWLHTYLSIIDSKKRGNWFGKRVKTELGQNTGTYAYGILHIWCIISYIYKEAECILCSWWFTYYTDWRYYNRR